MKYPVVAIVADIHAVAPDEITSLASANCSCDGTVIVVNRLARAYQLLVAGMPCRDFAGFNLRGERYAGSCSDKNAVIEWIAEALHTRSADGMDTSETLVLTDDAAMRDKLPLHLLAGRTQVVLKQLDSAGSAAHPDMQPGSPEQIATVVSAALGSNRRLQLPSVPRVRDVAASKGTPFDLGKVRRDFAEANDYFWGEHGKPVDYAQAGLRYERVIDSVAGDDMSATAKLRLGIIYATGADRYYPKDHDAAKLYLKAAIDECGAEQDRRLAKAHYARILEAEDSIGVKEAQIAQLYIDALDDGALGDALGDELTYDALYYLGRYHLGKTGSSMTSWWGDPEDCPIKKDPTLGMQYLIQLMIRLPGGHEKIPLVRALLEHGIE